MQRDLFLELSGRLRVPSRRAAIIEGPRQVGKTVLLLQLAADLLDAGVPPRRVVYFDFSDDRVPRETSPREVVEHAKATAPTGDSGPWYFFFDEIGRLARWNEWLKQAVDQAAGRFVVTDSAATLLRLGAIESGLGRWDEYRLETFSLSEAVRLLAALPTAGLAAVEDAIAAEPNLLERYLSLGGFPGPLRELDSRQALADLRVQIVERALYRDLRGQVEAVEELRDLFVYLMAMSGAIFNSNERAADLGVDARSVLKWVRLLQHSCLVRELPRWASRPSGRLRIGREPKIYASDPGLVSAFSVPGGDPALPGRCLEAAVLRHLVPWARDHSVQLAYLRERDGADRELDFVLEQGPRRWVIEVTTSRQVRPEKLAALRWATQRLGPGSRRLLVAPVLSPQRRDAIEVVPVTRFLLDTAEVLA